MSRMYKGSPLTERAELRRTQLIAAGRRLFGSEGYAAVSVRAVCVEAGLTERYFYETFANKEALLAAVYLHAVGELNDRLQPSLASAGPVAARTREGLNAYFGFMKEKPDAARIVLFEVLGVSAEIDGLYREVIAQFAGQLRKQLGLKDATLMSGGLVGAAVQIATQWVLGGFVQPQRAVVDSCARILLAVAKAD